MEKNSQDFENVAIAEIAILAPRNLEMGTYKIALWSANESLS